VRVGEWNTANATDCEYDNEGNEEFCAPPPIDIKVVGQIVHPEFVPKSSTSYHDIALVRLAKRVKFNDYVKPICLPLDAAFETIDYTGYSFEVTGWGKIAFELIKR
jgi:hypothetical protein